MDQPKKQYEISSRCHYLMTFQCNTLFHTNSEVYQKGERMNLICIEACSKVCVPSSCTQDKDDISLRKLGSSGMVKSFYEREKYFHIRRSLCGFGSRGVLLILNHKSSVTGEGILIMYCIFDEKYCIFIEGLILTVSEATGIMNSIVAHHTGV